MTYEYVCTACGHGWEAEQRISAAPLKACPSCQQDAAKRQVSGGAGFILKGSGWYADLYSSPKPGGKENSAEAKAEAKGEAKTDGKVDGKVDGKPAAKTEPKKDGSASGTAPSTSSSTSGGDASSSTTSSSTPTKPANAAPT